jgi:hypothetical protein
MINVTFLFFVIFYFVFSFLLLNKTSLLLFFYLRIMEWFLIGLLFSFNSFLRVNYWLITDESSSL